jgi:hypothetical protein
MRWCVLRADGDGERDKVGGPVAAARYF